jgi:hypothetical protein
VRPNLPETFESSGVVAIRNGTKGLVWGNSAYHPLFSLGDKTHHQRPVQLGIMCRSQPASPFTSSRSTTPTTTSTSCRGMTRYRHPFPPACRMTARQLVNGACVTTGLDLHRHQHRRQACLPRQTHGRKSDAPDVGLGREGFISPGLQ